MKDKRILRTLWKNFEIILGSFKQIHKFQQKFQENIENYKLNFIGIMKYFETAVIIYFFLQIRNLQRRTQNIEIFRSYY